MADKPFIATIEVTPYYDDLDTLTCVGDSVSFTITINPSAQVEPIEDIVFCDGVDTPIINFFTSNGGGDTSYQWEVIEGNGLLIGLPSNSGNEFIESFIRLMVGLANQRLLLW